MNHSALQLLAVHSQADAEAVSVLAANIWHECYPKLIGLAQVEYMLQKFQSKTAITKQLAQGYEYFFITAEGVKLGYLCVIPDPVTQSLHLSKFYIVAKARRQGVGSFALTQLESMAKQQALAEIWLTVNKHNHMAIAAYQKMGFSIVSEPVNSIGRGFVMDDYEMRKQLSTV